MPNRLGGGFLLAGMALQNLWRREARTLLLLAGVAICSGAVFTGDVLMRSIESSMSVGFTRLGADMLVVPAGALTNITAALLTAEPTDQTFDDSDLAHLQAIKGVQKLAPQLVFRTDASGYRRQGRDRRRDRVRPCARLHDPAMARATSQSADPQGRHHRRRAARRCVGRQAAAVRIAGDGLRQARKDGGGHARARLVHDVRDARRDAPRDAENLRAAGSARTQQAVRRAASAGARRNVTASALCRPREFPSVSKSLRANRCSHRFARGWKRW